MLLQTAALRVLSVRNQLATSNWLLWQRWSKIAMEADRPWQ